MNSTYVLGIHDGHNSTAALLKNGKICSAISEERLTREKNTCGFPRRSIDQVIEIEGISPEDIDRVAISSNFMHSEEHLKSKELWYRVGETEQRLEEQKSDVYKEKLFRVRRNERIEAIKTQLGMDDERIQFVEHHKSHAAAAYFGSPYSLNEGVLVLTCDGAGDGLAATVSVGRGGSLDRIAETSRHDSLGKIYSRVTYLMGMTPWEHEYKIMGLAPYADEYGVERSEAVFEELLGISDDGLGFAKENYLSMNYIYFHLRDKLENHRFDWIAGGVQSFTEKMMVRWVENAVENTGIHRVACGGGVFMNIKANMVLRQSPSVHDIFVFPSCGDESNAIGAAFVAFRDLTNGTDPCLDNILPSIYLGKEYDDDDVEAAIGAADLPDECRVQRMDDIHEHVGRELAKGKIVARSFGRMEWGARALGNRSILADASIRENVRKINEMIKMRDFWMPFAPSILFERAEDYLEDWAGEPAPFMIMGYESTELAETDMPAAMHPYDRTIRPQLVRREDNPEYWRVLKAYEKETGRGGVLNTSFNLHGYPIVNRPEEALDVYLRSGLKNIALGSYYISEAV